MDNFATRCILGIMFCIGLLVVTADNSDAGIFRRNGKGILNLRGGCSGQAAVSATVTTTRERHGLLGLRRSFGCSGSANAVSQAPAAPVPTSTEWVKECSPSGCKMVQRTKTVTAPVTPPEAPAAQGIVPVVPMTPTLAPGNVEPVKQTQVTVLRSGWHPVARLFGR